ncbi:TPA: right-handed parallel beta-helix repeat-containing protein [Serratia fonticola]
MNSKTVHFAKSSFLTTRRLVIKKLLLGATIGSLFLRESKVFAKEEKYVDNNLILPPPPCNSVVDADKEITNILKKGLVNIHDFMTAEQIADANSRVPRLDHSDALIKALQTSNGVYFPNVSGYYLIKDVIVPEGCWLVGNSFLPYVVKNRRDINGVGSGIVVADGGSSIFKFNKRVTLFGLVLYGGAGYKTDGLQAADNARVGGFRALYCGFYGFRIAIGQKNRYIGVDLTSCTISSNIIGVSNIIDSKILGGFINNNRGDGVSLQKGANDNVFMNVKNEWNGGNNYSAYLATNNVITSGICDRAGHCGVKSISSTWIINGAVFRRNGAKAGGSNTCTHFYLEGEGATLIANGIFTSKGGDDGGTGYVTPENSLVTTGKTNEMHLVVSGCDLSGFTVKPWLRTIVPIKCSINGNIGIADFNL